MIKQLFSYFQIPGKNIAAEHIKKKSLVHLNITDIQEYLDITNILFQL